MSERQKVTIALIASLFLHGVILIVIALILWLQPQSVAGVPEIKQLHVTLVAKPEPPKPREEAPVAPKPTPPPLLAKLEPPAPKKIVMLDDSEGLAKAEKPPERPVFESDKNSVAGSELPATGDAPLPSQAGKDRLGPRFEDKAYSAGKIREDVIPQPQARPAPPVPPKPELQPKPVVKPSEPVQQPTPAPAPTPMATPPPEPIFKPVPLPLPTARPDGIKIEKAAATPAATPAPTPLPLIRPKPELAVAAPSPVTVAMLATPAPARLRPREQRTAPPVYQEEKDRTKIEGSITNRGKRGVDAVETPLGKYRKSMATTIGARWNEYVRSKMDLITVGSAHVRFFVTRDGRVEDIKLLSNSSSEAFATYTIKAIMDASVPALPPDIVPLLENGRLEIEYTFTIYPE